MQSPIHASAASLLALGVLASLQQPGAEGDVPSYELVAPGELDALSVPVTDGIVWYGTWESAMAERERTGRPVLLHLGSPRFRVDDVKVPGTW